MRKCFLHSAQDDIDQLVREAVQTELRRLAAEEVLQWASCFCPGASKNKAAQVARIVKTASSRMLCAQMSAAISQ
jgi:hypothetical protein